MQHFQITWDFQVPAHLNATDAVDVSEKRRLTSVCWVQRPSSGTSAVRKVRGARAQSRESSRSDKLLDTRTHFCSNAKAQRRQRSTAATRNQEVPLFSSCNGAGLWGGSVLPPADDNVHNNSARETFSSLLT